MNGNAWVWILLGISLVAIIVGLMYYSPTTSTKQQSQGTAGTVKTGGTETVAEENVVQELNVEVPEVNEEVVDINVPEEI